MRLLKIATLKRGTARFARDEEGATTVEYAFMIVMILGACMATFGFLAQKTQQNFNDSAAALDAAFN